MEFKLGTTRTCTSSYKYELVLVQGRARNKLVQLVRARARPCKLFIGNEGVASLVPAFRSVRMVRGR